MINYSIELKDPVLPVGVQHSSYLLRTLRLETKLAGSHVYLTVLRFSCDKDGKNLEVDPLPAGLDSNYIEFNKKLKKHYGATLPRYMGGKKPTLDEVEAYRLAICDVLDNLDKFV